MPPAEDPTLDRRSFTALLGLAGTGQLSSASSQLPDISSIQMQADGTLVIGVPSLPQTLNLFRQRRDALGIFDAIYDSGIVFNPNSGEITPWAFTSWQKWQRTNPTQIMAFLRTDLTWHDGTPVTADDVVFTARYLREHHDIAPRFEVYKHLDEVEAMDSDQVMFTFDAGIGAWQSHLMGSFILPKHRWEGVADPTQHRPSDSGGPIGSGPFQVERFEGGLLRLERRSDDYTHPPSKSVDFFDSGGPHIDALEFREVPGEPKQAVNELLRGDVTAVSYSDRFGLRRQRRRVNQAKGVSFERSPSFSLRRIGFNLRLRPLTDDAFRRFLAHAWTDDFYLDRIADDWATPGDLVAPPAITDLRPFEPGSSESNRYQFVGEDGKVDVGRLRRMLQGDDDASYSYQFLDAETMSEEKLPNGELHLDGQPFGEAWEGEGPMRIVTADPPGVVEKALRDWVTQLRRVGVPVVLEVLSEAELETQVHRNHDFHVFEELWHVDDSLLTDLPQDYGPLGINPDGYSYNPMGYTGSKYVEKARNTTVLEQRNEYVTQALSEIYADLPVMVYAYPAIYEPVHENWSGWMHADGGITNMFTWLNVRKTGPYVGGLQTATQTPAQPTQTATATASPEQQQTDDNDGGNLGIALGIGAGGFGAIGGLVALKLLWGRLIGGS